MPECTTCACAPYNKESHTCQRCFDYTPLGKPVYKHWARALPTNADRIGGMSDEELAEWMRDMMDCVSCRKVMSRSDITCTGNYKECVNRCKQWLRQPAEEVHDGEK